MAEMHPTAGGSVQPRGEFLSLAGDTVSRYVWASPLVKGHKVLEVGCGHGAGTCYLAEGSAAEVHGIDVDAGAVAFARARYSRPNLRFEVADMPGGEAFTARFDTVISFEVVEHVGDPEAFLAFIRRALRPGGQCLISTPNRLNAEQFYRPDGSRRNPLHLREYYPAEFQSVVERQFRIEQWFVQHDLRTGEAGQAAIRRQVEQVDRCAIPQGMRRLVPGFLKQLYFKARGSGYLDPRGRYRDYVIEPVPGPAAMTRNHIYQLVQARAV